MHEQPTQRRHPGRIQRLPRNQQRERVLRLVREHDGAVDATELAALMDLHVTTVRFHLDALCADGTVARTRIKRGGVGRPRTGYAAVRERLDYRVLAEVLAMELGETDAERRPRAERAGRKWAERILAERPVGPERPSRPASSGIDGLTQTITQVFNRMGFDPELDAVVAGDRERSMRLYGCPVRDLAQCHPEVSCSMHLGLLRGLLDPGADDESGQGQHLRAELEPFVEPELCVARVIVDD